MKCFFNYFSLNVNGALFLLSLCIKARYWYKGLFGKRLRRLVIATEGDNVLVCLH